MEQLIFPVTKKEAEKNGKTYSSEANKKALFPSQLRDLRKKKGISQETLAHDLGVSKSTIGLYETGDTLPDAKTLRDLAVYFGVSADWLLGLSDYAEDAAEKKRRDTIYKARNLISELYDNRFRIDYDTAVEIIKVLERWRTA